MSNTTLGNYQKLKSWFLIIFLSLLPGFIFLWDWNPEGEDNFRRLAARKNWFDQSEKTASMFRRSSENAFWQRIMISRFMTVFEDGRDNGLSPEKSFRRAFSLCRPEGFPKVGAMCFYRNKSGWEVFSPGDFNPGPVFLFKKLFEEMVLHFQGQKNDLESSTWEQRIKMLFGHMIFPQLFSARLRGQPFAVMVKSRPFTAVWELFENSDRKIDAGFFLFFPGTYETDLTAITLTLQHWNHVCDLSDTYPVFIDISEKGGFLLHRHIDTPEIRGAVEKFRSQYITRVRSNVPELSDKARLPGELMGRTFELGGKLARVCPLSAVSSHVGLLLAENPAPEKTLRQNIAEAYFFIAAVVWGMFFIRAAIFRLIPAVELRFRVMAWFLAFASFPAGLTLTSWSSLLQDFTTYRVSQIQKGLEDSIMNIEAGLAGPRNSFRNAANAIVELPQVKAEILKLPVEPDRENRLFKDILALFEKDGIKPSGVVLVTQGGWYFSRFDNEQGQLQRNHQVEAMGAILNQVLMEADRGLHQQLALPNRSDSASRKVPAILDFANLDVQNNVNVIRGSYGKATDWHLHEKNYLQFVQPIYLNNRPFAFFIALWELSCHLPEFLRNRLHLESLSFREKWGFVPDFAVFSGKLQPKLMVKSGNFRGLADLAPTFPDRIIHFAADPFSTTLMMPSARFPDVFYAARVSTVSINMLMTREKWLIVTVVLVLLSLILLGAGVASLWITSPIKRFIKELTRLNCGERAEIPESARSDEIGLTTLSLRRMAQWIDERQRLVKFISPKVLDLISGGNVFKAGAGSIQQVTVLVSDIKSFTGLSETYAPHLVFAMVSIHLQAMAATIRRNGGMVDRFVGDAVWAVFYGPLAQSGIKALTAAGEMMLTHEQIQAERANRGEFGYGIGIGLYHGTALVGVMGDSSVRLDFSIVGEALNKAEHLESMSRGSRGTGIIIDEKLASCAAELGLPIIELPDASGIFEVSAIE